MLNVARLRLHLGECTSALLSQMARVHSKFTFQSNRTTYYACTLHLKASRCSLAFYIVSGDGKVCSQTCSLMAHQLPAKRHVQCRRRLSRAVVPRFDFSPKPSHQPPLQLMTLSLVGVDARCRGKYIKSRSISALRKKRWGETGKERRNCSAVRIDSLG